MILVGEIRDYETAQIAVEASLTGHVVFSTLHTNDAPLAITRMLDLGVEPFLVAATLEAVIAQRLVRTICPNCKVTYEPGTEVGEVSVVVKTFGKLQVFARFEVQKERTGVLRSEAS